MQEHNLPLPLVNIIFWQTSSGEKYFLANIIFWQTLLYGKHDPIVKIWIIWQLIGYAILATLILILIWYAGMVCYIS